MQCNWKVSLIIYFSLFLGALYMCMCICVYVYMCVCAYVCMHLLSVCMCILVAMDTIDVQPWEALSSWGVPYDCDVRAGLQPSLHMCVDHTSKMFFTRAKDRKAHSVQVSLTCAVGIRPRMHITV